MEKDERRRHRRYSYDGSVTYRRLGPEAPGRIRNLSEGGLMVELPELLPPGTPLDLMVSLGDRAIHAEAEVVWSQDRPGNAGTSYVHGFKFVRLELQDRLTLAVFIAKVYGG
ncbi:MAG: PilZ domain-containing protein [Candidatus Methylomirabilales bacterium]